MLNLTCYLDLDLNVSGMLVDMIIIAIKWWHLIPAVVKQLINEASWAPFY